MPRPTPPAVRTAIRKRSLLGEAPADIARALRLPARTVRHLLRSSSATAADYSACGRLSSVPDSLRDALRLLRAENPGWGAPFLRCWLPRLGFDDLPSTRTIQRILADEPPLPVADAAEEQTRPRRPGHAHEVWQVDAADQVKMADGSLTCWLRFVDWASGAVLRSIVFPPTVLVERPGARGANGLPPCLHALG